MTRLLDTRWFYLASGIFLMLYFVALWFEFYYFALLPLALMVLWAAFFRLDALLLFIVLCTPFSLNLEELELGGIGMYLPTEPLMFGVLVVFVFKLLSGKSIDTRIFFHPVSYILYAYLVWMFLTCITSEIPLVSFKFMLARMWFIGAFYFLSAHIFLEAKRVNLFLLFYIFPLIAVVVYTITRHAGFGFDKDSSHWVMEPFYKDHTSYGAVLAMFFPVVAGLLMQRKTSLLLRTLLAIGFVILTAGLVLSYTRAAWISLFGAAILLVALLLKIRLRTLLAVTAVSGTLLYIGWEDIMISLQRNKQESSDKLEEHVSSISNVSSDASNLERLNRWNCAFEMWKERPVTGWGPGTYQFVYAPFQRSKDRTIISTNEGTGGNAHSEYFGPLCEQGLPGMLIMILLVYSICNLGFRLYFRKIPGDQKILLTAIFLGLVTYFIHGTLNNYLDTDKAGIPFWGFIAALVAADILATGSEEPAAQ